jgi:energy-coupling factor transporter ATP-binding protein EcfA2
MSQTAKVHAPLMQGRFRASYGSFHLNAEFEAPAQGITAIFGHSGSGKTSLLRVTSTLPHTLYGNGVHARLEIPVFGSASEAAALADELNRWELCGADLPPLFGAWSAGPRAPTFVCFIPNQFCLPGLPLTLTVWALARHRHVRQWLSGSVSQH